MTVKVPIRRFILDNKYNHPSRPQYVDWLSNGDIMLAVTDGLKKLGKESLIKEFIKEYIFASEKDQLDVCKKYVDIEIVDETDKPIRLYDNLIKQKDFM